MPSKRDACVATQAWTGDKITLRLIVGPDHYHPAHLEVKSVDELMDLLGHQWIEIYNRIAQVGGELESRISEAVYDWNSSFADEEEQAYPRGWKWLGFMFYGEIGPIRWELSLSDRTIMNVSLDANAIESKAMSTCREIYGLVADVLKREVDL